MEKISKHNYEAFWLDHMEGNLDELATIALFAFLEQHPELKAELETYDALSLDPEDVYFDAKSSLKHIPEEIEEKIVAYLDGQLSETEKTRFEKEIALSSSLQKTLAEYQKTFLTNESPKVFTAKHQLKRSAIAEEQIIAYMEGQLSFQEITAFEKSLAGDEIAQATLNTYKQTKIEADRTIVFPDKKGLKREATVVRLFAYRTALSIAASVALILGLFWLLRSTETNGMEGKGSMALQKIMRKKSQSTDTIQAAVPTKLLAGNPLNPSLNKAIRLPLIQKQDSGLKPVNTPLQNLANNTIQPVDTNRNKAPKNNSNLVEPRGMIALNPYIENEPENISNTSKKTALSTTEIVAQKINKVAWGDDDEKENTKALTPEKKKVKGFDVLALIGKGLKKLGNQRSDAKKIEDREKDYTEYVVTIGSISVSKKVAN